MPQFKGKFEYVIDGKKVTQEEFQKTVDNNETRYNVEIDNLRVKACSKKVQEPFFLDEVIFSAPKNQVKTDEDILNSLLKPHLVGSELREEWKYGNTSLVVDKILKVEKELWNTNNTGGTIFEKVQDYALSKDNDYSITLDCKFPTSINDLSVPEIGKVWLIEDNLDVYNDIVGHSTRHKAGREIKTEDIWNDEKKQAVSQSILTESGRQSLQEKAKIKALGEKYRKEDKNLGKKETEGKLDYSEINFELLDLMAKRFMDNKIKYPKGNTLKKIDKDEILWAAFRHIRKMIQPIDNDPENYKDHLAAVATNLSIILDQLNLENE